MSFVLLGCAFQLLQLAMFCFLKPVLKNNEKKQLYQLYHEKKFIIQNEKYSTCKKPVATHTIVLNGYIYGSVTYKTLFQQISIKKNFAKPISHIMKKSKTKQNPKAKHKSNSLFPNLDFIVVSCSLPSSKGFYRHYMSTF